MIGAVTHKSEHAAVWTNAKSVLSTAKFINSHNKQVTVPTIKNWLRNINNVEYLIKKLSINIK